ncbi:alpha/beta hydrolase domain-containing protein [Muricoccus radiodurans]|uniref:alpha/beta hydrolase domain-containing protein n=1 Tax=Muricoccus radiodurans TaxID=2231721 RepID=UPI003CF6303A
MRMMTLALGFGLLTGPAMAEVVRFEMTAPPRPALGGASFGSTGAYEEIRARATIALDPADPRNAVIADLDRAPRNAQGRVEATADVIILRPADAARGNGTLLMEAPNRGNRIIGQLLNDAPRTGATRMEGAADAGNGWTFRQGYTLAWVGWQGDWTPGSGMRVDVPKIDGITGPSREEFVFDNTTSPAQGRLTYPVADPSSLVLTVRARQDDPRQRPADMAVRLVAPDRIEITRPAGFDAGAIYELTYTARDPLVLGMGFAAFRDVAAFLRRDGTASNPMAANGRSVLTGATAFGVSQSGRFLRDLLYLGFNEDERGRQVFDGMVAHIPGSRRSFTNARFAQPGRNPSDHTDRLYPADQFPFTYAVTTDPLTGLRDGLLRRCRTTATCPRIFQTDSEFEYWGARGSLTVTDAAGRHVDLPPEVRAYMMIGHPHYAEAQAVANRTQSCVMPVNPLQAGAPMRALMVALEAWIKEGVEPPASRTPMVAHGTLVAAPAFPGVQGMPAFTSHTPAPLLDLSQMPPAVTGRYPVLFPRLDADGNAIGGIRLPVIEAARATYTGWNPRAEGFAPGALCTNTGGVLPLAGTRAERMANNDPRPSIEERWPDRAAYVAAVRQAAERLAGERLLLPEDVQATVAAAEAGTLDRLRTP